MNGLHFRKVETLDRHQEYDRRQIEDWWCVEIEGKNYHIHSKTVIHPKKGYLPKQVTVNPCNGSCKKSSDIPNDIWQEACSQLEIDPERHVSIPPECIQKMDFSQHAFAFPPPE